MTRIAIVVEGRTEEEFVKRLLAGHLARHELAVTPILHGLKRRREGRGGNVTVDTLATQLARLAANFDHVTSLVDLYGFRGREGLATEALTARVAEIARERVGRRHHRRRLCPYVQQFEFEALLFANVERFSVVGADAAVIADLGGVLADAGHDPEEINDGVATAPSKCILRLLDSYDKLLDGLLVAEAIGLRHIRERCSRFNEWIRGLEELGKPTTRNDR